MPANPNVSNACQQLDLLLRNNLPVEIDPDRVKWHDGPFITPSSEPWVWANIDPLDNNFTAAEGPWERTEGDYIVQCFYPTSATKPVSIDAISIAESIKRAMQNRRPDGVKTWEGVIDVVGSVSDSAWYQVNLTIRWSIEGLVQ